MNKKCIDKNTALHAAFMPKKPLNQETEKDIQAQLEVIHFLMRNKGDLDVLNLQGQTPIAFGRTKLLELLNLRNGKAIFESKEVQLHLGLRTFNKDFYNQKIIIREEPEKLLYPYKRCSSASTMSCHPVVESYEPYTGKDLYTRRNKYMLTE